MLFISVVLSVLSLFFSISLRDEEWRVIPGATKEDKGKKEMPRSVQVRERDSGKSKIEVKYQSL